MKAEKNIQKALEALLGEDPLLPLLAAVLETGQRQEPLTYEDTQRMAGDETAEVLLLAWDWKLLLPRRSIQCAEWDDRVIRFEAGEHYEMPNIVRYLLDQAAETGAWEADTAIRDLYAAMGEPACEKMPDLVRKIVKSAAYRCIDASALHGACARAGLGDRTDSMIAVLKGGGLISPRMRGAALARNRRSPVYDIHPVITG